MRQLTLDLQPAAPPSLENYVTGSNGEALTALAAWLAPDNREPLFFLWGESGAGKSHLLQACAATGCDARLDPELAGLPASSDPWAVDHLEVLGDSGQIALFNLINRLRANGGRLLLAARLPPRLLELREDLRTRLGNGLVYRLRSLSDAEKRAALAEQARARGLELSPAIIDYLFARVPRDMRSLTQLLRAIDQFSLEHKRPITLPLLREVLQTSPPT
ncbi:DnaA regulatory inactivator Hda [Accumulibacter sp.]|jgi:DnaA family protein|uniref:DnaA regulatory inactivator Hda n=1 Tax=Accumulibacter sp. TaxID=2053492 RepID=UPI001AD3F94A|nr:DnaA regulatory inactivator Hda [Accumulibacter sp.]MBN8453230.1 DnaA regulatory inactivator Hda [Accumulibacter sp.]